MIYKYKCIGLKNTGWMNMIRDIMADLPDVTVEQVGWLVVFN